MWIYAINLHVAVVNLIASTLSFKLLIIFRPQMAYFSVFNMVRADYSTSCIYGMVLDVNCMSACTFPKSFVLFFFIHTMSEW